MPHMQYLNKSIVWQLDVILDPTGRLRHIVINHDTKNRVALLKFFSKILTI